jgi:hypothetical protein
MYGRMARRHTATWFSSLYRYYIANPVAIWIPYPARTTFSAGAPSSKFSSMSGDFFSLLSLEFDVPEVAHRKRIPTL